MNKEIKEKWIAALRSGKFKQGETLLHDTTYDQFCCLGVLATVMGYEPNTVKNSKDEEYLRQDILRKAGFGNSTQVKLSEMNDGTAGRKKHSFLEIADYIERNL